MNNEINLNDLYSQQAYSDFINSKLFYYGIINENFSNILLEKTNNFQNSPNEYIDYINSVLIPNNILEKEVVNENINTILQTIITNILRPYIYDIIIKMNEKMKNYGQFIISGGEAFNLNVPKEFRQITPDIDTKFIPFFNQKIPNEYDYASKILKIREYFWYEVLEDILEELNKNYENMYNLILKPIENCPELTLFNLKFLKPEDIKDSGEPFRKRLTILPKENNPERMMFYDLNLFAIDLFVERYSSFSLQIGSDGISIGNKILANQSYTIDGILDLPFMRPGQFGYDIGETNNNISIYVNNYKLDKKYNIYQTCLLANIYRINENIPTFTNKIIRIASSNFILDDINEMIKLNLRKNKSEKDNYRERILQKIKDTQDYQLPIVMEDQSNSNYSPIKQISITKLKNVFYKDNLNRMTLSKILKYIAPPTIIANGQIIQQGLFNTDIFRNILSTVQISSNTIGFQYISLEEAHKFLGKSIINTFIKDAEEKQYITIEEWQNIINYFDAIYVEQLYGAKYDYQRKIWIEQCCDSTPLDTYCCDPVGNQFRFRINNNRLSILFFSKTEKVNEIIKAIFSEIGNYIDSIIEDIDNANIDLAKNKLGMMLYEYNPNYSINVSIPDIISNILMIMAGLRWIEPELYDFIHDNIIEKLFNLRRDYSKKIKQIQKRNMINGLIIEEDIEEVSNSEVRKVGNNIILPKGISIFKGMEKMSDEELKTKLHRIRKNVTSYYTTTEETANRYAELYHGNNGKVYKFLTKKNTKLLWLNNPDTLEKILPEVIDNDNIKSYLQFMFGYKITSKDQYNLYKKYLIKFDMKETDYKIINQILVRNDRDLDDLKRCSIYEIDDIVLKYLCKKYNSKKFKHYEIDGFYISEMPTNYCTRGTKFCDDNNWHEEVIFCDSKQVLIYRE